MADNFSNSLIRRYLIESGISVAPIKYARKLYPFAEMKVGDSFALAESTWQEVDRVRASIQDWQKRHPPMKFSVRQISPTDKNYRCWRIA